MREFSNLWYLNFTKTYLYFIVLQDERTIVIYVFIYGVIYGSIYRNIALVEQKFFGNKLLERVKQIVRLVADTLCSD